MNTNSPKLYVLIGLPGSGKSTWTTKFLRDNNDINFTVVSSDAIIERYATERGKTYSEVFSDVSGFAMKEMSASADDAFNNNRNIIWDQTNMSVKKRKCILQRAKGYVKIAVDFDVSDKELQRRLDERAKTTGKVIPKNIVDSMAKNYDEPTKAEGFDQIIRIRQ